MQIVWHRATIRHARLQDRVHVLYAAQIHHQSGADLPPDHYAGYRMVYDAELNQISKY